MLLLFLTFYCVTISYITTASGATVKDEELLEWPSRYTVKGLKLSLNSDDTPVEDFQIWKANKTISRVDCFNGAAKSITTIDPELGIEVTYKIHPITTEETWEETSCKWQKETPMDNTEFLPEDAFYFSRVGTELLRDVETVKFELNEDVTGADSRRTMWATYVNGTWIPIRYEVLEYNLDLGSLDKHEIRDYYDFKKDFDDDVFDVSEYVCEKEDDDEIQTKHLKFINPDNDRHVDYVFQAFKQKFKKHYANEKEHALRRSLFRRKMRKIISKNRQALGYKLAINEFSDRTPEEMKKYMGLKRRSVGEVGNIAFPYNEEQLNSLVDDLPTSYDLRLNGVITPARHQGECGSCYSFATTTAMEGSLARSNGGRLLRLSNQAIIDCSWEFGNDGCNGGTDVNVYKWMMEYGIPTEEEYGPYIGQDGYCLLQNMSNTYTIKGFTDVTPLSVNALKVALVNHGPLTVSIDASSTFSEYSSGIFYDNLCNQTSLNHEVTLVGYGEENDELFWIIKNSWGKRWGEDGYIYMSARNNNCGVTTEPTYVVV